jgi:UDP-glucose 4-epimerase
MNILVTGGAGYIGSHTVIELVGHNHNVIIIDTFSNSSPEVINRIKNITGRDVRFYKGAVQDKALLQRVFEENKIDAAIHFAGYKAVGESVKKPLVYYRNNIESALALCEVMQAAGVRKLIFSSSATVYSPANELPWSESGIAGLGIAHPYGQTKYMIEQILRDLVLADPSWEIIALRYFNPIGAHPSGHIGEDPHGTPNNLIPYISQVAVGKRKKLHIFGGDYDTPDGTAIRDYIHVVDVAKGHQAALEHLAPAGEMRVYNLGTGVGVSVLEVVKAFERVSGKRITYDIVERRAGDLPRYFADPSKAQDELEWVAKKTLLEACADSWRWQSLNPHGYLSNATNGKAY